MADDRNYLQTIEGVGGNLYGSKPDQVKILGEFAKLDQTGRAAMLDQFDRSIMEGDTANLKEYARLCKFHRDMKGLHLRMIKVGK